MVTEKLINVRHCIVVIIMLPVFEENLEGLMGGLYRDKLETAVKNNKSSLTVDYNDLAPESQKILREDYFSLKYVGTTIDEFITYQFGRMAVELGLKRRPKNIILKFSNIPIKLPVRSLGVEHINGLIEVNGIIISVVSPKAFITKAVYLCGRCGEKLTVIQTGTDLTKPASCPCSNRAKSFVLVESECEWNDYQEVILQENPEEVNIGVIPRTLRLRLVGKQLVDSCLPGNVVNVTCMPMAIPSGSRNKRIFDIILDSNNVEVLSKESYNVELDESDHWELLYLAEDKNIMRRLLNSIFPSIYGRDLEKLGLVLAMFGGTDEKKPDVTRRGTINVIMIGDPGVGKTRMLQGIMNAAPKATYASGKGASGVGLTAAAIQDQSGWRLEAGAVVLADSGICCVDEIDKMDNPDREKIHEAMSKQTVTIHKANIHTTLNARTTILAAANPTSGRYDPYEILTDNIDLPITILSRFDLIYIMRDEPNEEEDRKIAERIFEVDTVPEEDMIPIETIKKYVLYARQLNPIFSNEAMVKIMEYYLPLRRRSVEVSGTPIAITTRQLEGLRRLAQASARMRLSNEVSPHDAEVAISLIDMTLSQAGYDPITGEIDANISQTGKPKSQADRRKQVEMLLIEEGGPIHISALEDLVKERLNMEPRELQKHLDSLRTEIYSPGANTYTHIKNANYVEGKDY